MELDQVVPWGRSFAEYGAMFALTEGDLRLSILGCADGPASFNAEGTPRGVSVVSCDPIYRFGREEIEGRVHATHSTIVERLSAEPESYVWTRFSDPESVGVARLRAARTFLDDFELGKVEGRYVDASLPSLPFGDGSFDLVLCSHLLFLYSAAHDIDFHLRAVREMIRVGHQVRIFPLLRLDGRRTQFVDPVADALSRDGYEVDVSVVDYQFQRGGDEMLRIRRRSPVADGVEPSPTVRAERTGSRTDDTTGIGAPPFPP